ncbi:hypothetical protein GC197_05370 [bacterium]|nr:hypothetical protein [bacterium]
MLLRSRIALLVFGTFSWVAALGCESKSYLPTEFVEGVVTLDGTPVEGANVTFVPVESSPGIAAIGVSDSAGVFHLTTLSSKDGLLPKHGGGALAGRYQVSVEKIVIPADIQKKLDDGIQVPYNPAAMIHGVPKKYETPETSGLEFDIVSGRNDLTLELTSR